MNRVQSAIDKKARDIQSRLASGQIDAEQLNTLSRNLDMDVMEYCKFQELKSLAVASGKLTLEEGQLIYGYLGTTPDTFNGQDVAIKVILTKIFSELMGIK